MRQYCVFCETVGFRSVMCVLLPVTVQSIRIQPSASVRAEYVIRKEATITGDTVPVSVNPSHLHTASLPLSAVSLSQVRAGTRFLPPRCFHSRADVVCPLQVPSCFSNRPFPFSPVPWLSFLRRYTYTLKQLTFFCPQLYLCCYWPDFQLYVIII